MPVTVPELHRGILSGVVSDLVARSHHFRFRLLRASPFRFRTPPRTTPGYRALEHAADQDIDGPGEPLRPLTGEELGACGMHVRILRRRRAVDRTHNGTTAIQGFMPTTLLDGDRGPIQQEKVHRPGSGRSIEAALLKQPEQRVEDAHGVGTDRRGGHRELGKTRVPEKNRDVRQEDGLEALPPTAPSCAADVYGGQRPVQHERL